MKISPAENESVTNEERSHWVEARLRSDNLVLLSQKLNDWLNGANGDPGYVEAVFKEADEVRLNVYQALSIRLSRLKG